jgi:RIO kinase 1
MYTSCRASPRLKDAEIPSSSCESLYTELVLTIRKMYHRCKLVHGDLSEYNILYHDEHLYIIDVSQSVEHDHPSAFDFLRNDIKNAEEFFGRLGVKGLGLRRCFEFVTKECVADARDEEEEDSTVLARWLADVEVGQQDALDLENNDIAPNRDVEGMSAHEDSVFFKSFIPRSLNELNNPERDVAVVNRGGGKELIYADTIGLVGRPERSVRFEGVGAAGGEESEESQSDGDEESEDGDENADEQGKEGYVERTPRGHRHEDRDAKKVRVPITCLQSPLMLTLHSNIQERKKAVKEAAKEKRKTKLPKAEKKRKIKATSHSKS